MKVARKSFVEKVAFPPGDNKAKWVHLTANGHRVVVRAKKEIILTSGPINTAKILLLSGIGPASVLTKAKIDVVADLGVGSNLATPIMVPIFVGFEQNWPVGDPVINKIDGLFNFLVHKDGSMTQANINHVVGYFNTGDESIGRNIGKDFLVTLNITQ